MDIVLRTKSETPIYEQLYEQISAQIINGTLAANACLPSIRAIARELGVGIITVKKAYEMLEEQGFLYTVAGKGCFVRPHSEDGLDDKRLRLAEEKMRPDIPYYRGLGLTADELAELVKKLYRE